MSANPGVRINVVRYSDADVIRPETDWQQVRMEIGTQLMAGSAPTLIDSYLVDPFDPRQAPFFFNWYELMSADPDFHEDDWFMNVFHGFSVDSRLLIFPLRINYFPIVANCAIPDLLEVMAEYNDGITLSELMQVNRYFSERHPQYYLEQHFSSAWIMQFGDDQFIDIETGWIDFGEEFVNLITYADSITCPDFTDLWRGSGRGLHGVWNSAAEQVKSERYLFHLDINMNFRYFLDFNQDIHLFAGMTPFTNDYRELLVSSTDSFLLNANATVIEKAIAWDFLMFAMQPENLGQNPAYGHMFYLHPPNRDLFNYLIREQMFADFGRNRSGSYTYPWFLGDVYDAIEGATQLMTGFAEMPMRSTRTYPRIIDDIIDENLYLFYAGLLSAEQAAQNIQNRVALVLMEMSR